MRVLVRLLGTLRRLRVQMAELVLLRCNLNRQALAQVARAHAGGIEMLHQIDGAPNQIERRGLVCVVACLRPARPREPR